MTAPLTAQRAAKAAQTQADNAKAITVLEAREKALDGTAANIDRVLKDPALDAYPDAKAKLKACAADAAQQKKVLTDEMAARRDLATALAADDKKGAADAKARLAALKSKNPKLYGKASIADPKVSCPDSLSTANCDKMIVPQRYPGYGGPGSPVSPNSPCFGTSLAEWPGLDDMVKSGCITPEERTIVQAMAANEGAFESVQAYDRAALTAGAMQKTMADDGRGELAAQLGDFKNKFKGKTPNQFDLLFGDKGWDVDAAGKLTYTDAKGVARTGRTLGTWLRAADKDTAAAALQPFRVAGRNEDFRKQQICDFADRVRSAADKRVTIGKTAVASGDILTSVKGKAMLLDTSVNAGANSSSFQNAVKAFYAANPKAGKDPAAWTADERSRNEADILQRFASTRRVTDRATRNKALNGLSDAANPAGMARNRPAVSCPDCT